MAIIVAVATRKGGAGKTTTTNNVATGLHMKGKRVLLVDVDQQANATIGVGIDWHELKLSLDSLFTDPELDPHEVIVQTAFGLHVLPGHRNLAKSERAMGPEDMYNLKAILEPLEDDYDYIIIDTPPSESFMTYNALAAAHLLLIPAATDSFSEDGVEEAMTGLKRAQKTYNPSLKLAGILPTKVNRTLVSQRILGNLMTDYPGLVLPKAVVHTTVVDQGNDVGEPIVIYEPDHPAAQAYMKVVEVIDGQQV